jgi:ABC-2 type transport system ATP-binding protein
MEDRAISGRKRELLDLIGLTAGPSTLVRDLPPGVKQSVALAAAMLHDPAVIFLDEPTAGVTPSARLKFWRLIRHLAGEGRAIFVTTHHMDEAEQCGRIALMRAGRIIALDSPGGLKRSAFPLPMIEIEAAPDAPEGWRERFFGDGRAGTLSPHGMRWHLGVRDEAEWERVSSAMPEALRRREIAPSLEDVFMRLVEGGDR